MLIKFANQIINTDKISTANYQPERVQGRGKSKQTFSSRLNIIIVETHGDNDDFGSRRETFSGYEADCIWKALCKLSMNTETE